MPRPLGRLIRGCLPLALLLLCGCAGRTVVSP
jgi:hypothetical protein